MAFTWEQVALALVRFGLQGALAIVIGFVAVRWALTCYKAEKTWERRLAAYAETSMNSVGRLWELTKAPQ